MSVAKKGAAECAGSRFKRSSMNGINVPKIIDMFTIKKSDMQIAVAIVKS